MPLPKPQAALLFNNYFDENSFFKLKQPLDIELILAGAYYNFVKGKGNKPKLDKKVPLPGSVSNNFEIPGSTQGPNVGHTPSEIYNPNFVEITTDKISVADLFNEFEFTSKKTKDEDKTTTIYISSNLYAALDIFFSVGGEKLAVPFIAGVVEDAALDLGEQTEQGIPLGKIGDLPVGAGQSGMSMTGVLLNTEGVDPGKVNTSTSEAVGGAVFNPMGPSGLPDTGNKL